MADDDAPLSSLAKAGSSKFDDDAPLAALAGAKANPPGRKSVTPKAPAKPGAPKAPTPKAAAGKALSRPAGKAVPKPGVKRKTLSSSTSSSSSSSSSSSNAPLQKAKPKAKKAPVKVLKRNASANEEEGELDSGGAVQKRKRSLKDEVVAALLCRWWYADYYVKNDWPPQEESFYEEALEKTKLRKVEIQEWEWVPEVDSSGRKKVYELTQFRGVFRDSAGNMVDLRPKDTCPCQNVFQQKDLSTLLTMLISAYENQKKDLANSKYNTEKAHDELARSIIKAKSLLASQQAKA